MKYGARSSPFGTAVMLTGGRHVAGFASDDAQESWPCAKPEVNVSFAATVASTALLGAPGAMAVPPAVPNRPPWKVLTYGGLAPTTSAMLPGKMSLKIPKPARSTVLGSNCHAMAVLGCRIARGVEENALPRCVWIAVSSG